MKKQIYSLSLLFISILFIPSSPLYGQRKTPDDIIGELLQQNNIFELNRQYPIYKNRINPRLKSLASALLHNAYNEIDPTIEALEELVTNHPDLGIDNALNLINLWGNLLIKKGEYKEAYTLITKQLADKTVQQQANGTTLIHLKNTQNKAKALQKQPKSSLERSATPSVVSLIDGNKVPVQVNGKEALFIFDTGADVPAFVSKQFAEEHHIKIFNQTITTGGVIGSDYTQIGFVDSLKIGNLVYRNFWTLVAPNNQILYNDTVIAEVDAVLGRHFMERVGEFHLYSTENKIVFPVRPTPPPQEKNLLVINGQPYIEVKLNGKKYPLHLDTGGGIALYSKYYNENKSWIVKRGIKEVLGIGGFGGAKQLSIYMLPTMELTIAGVPTFLEEVPIYTTDEIRISQDGYGMLGMDILSRFYKVIVSFNNQFLKIERL
ncbi:MAG: retropepsin-like aspartic protease [Bacteroidaceae bacterium]